MTDVQHKASVQLPQLSMQIVHLPYGWPYPANTDHQSHLDVHIGFTLPLKLRVTSVVELSENGEFADTRPGPVILHQLCTMHLVHSRATAKGAASAMFDRDWGSSGT